MLATPPDFDVLIVGAGISGIGMAAQYGNEGAAPQLSPLSSGATIWAARGICSAIPASVRTATCTRWASIFEPWRHEKKHRRCACNPRISRPHRR